MPFFQNLVNRVRSQVPAAMAAQPAAASPASGGNPFERAISRVRNVAGSVAANPQGWPNPSGGGFGGSGIPLATLMAAFGQRGAQIAQRNRSRSPWEQPPAPGEATSAGIVNPNPPRLEDLSPEQQARFGEIKSILDERSRQAATYPPSDVIIEENPQGPKAALSAEEQAKVDRIKALLQERSRATAGGYPVPDVIEENPQTPQILTPEDGIAQPAAAPENPFMQLFRRPPAATAAYGPAALGDLMKGIDLSSILKGALGRPQPASAPGAVYLPSSTPGVALGQAPPASPAPGIPLNRLMAARRGYARPVRRGGPITTMPAARPVALA